MTLREFLINCLHLVLVIENNLCRLISLTRILLMLAMGCLKVYVGSFTVSSLLYIYIYICKLNIVNYIICLMTPSLCQNNS